MLNSIVKSLTFIGSLSILFADPANAEFAKYQVLGPGEAQVVRSEAVAEKEGFLANLPIIGRKLEKQYGEKTTLEVAGNCSISLLESSVIIDVEKGPIKETYFGLPVFVLTGYLNKHQSRQISISGARGERTVKGVSISMANPDVRYNEYIRHPVERFCQNFIKQVPNVRSFHISVGNEIKQKLEINEKDGTILISEEGICNVTTHKVALKCATGASQMLTDFIDFQEQNINNQ